MRTFLSSLLILVLGVSGARLFADEGSALWDTVKGAINESIDLNFEYHADYERAEANEIDTMWEIAFLMFKNQMTRYQQALTANPGGVVTAVRDAHAKGHGCAAAEFQVAAEDQIDKSLRSGIFSQPGKKFEALVRFSNGAGQVSPDGTLDGRGLAVKILNIGDGANKNILGTGATQDFLMINSPEFFVRNLSDYRDFQTSNQSFVFTKLLAEIGKNLAVVQHPLNVRALVPALQAAMQPGSDPTAIAAGFAQALATAGVTPENTPAAMQVIMNQLSSFKKGESPREWQVINQIQKSYAENVFGMEYFSMSPYLLRVNSTTDHAVKYKWMPIKCERSPAGSNDIATLNEVRDVNNLTSPDRSQPEFLRAGMTTDLANTSRCFDFYIQVLPQTFEGKELKGEAALSYTEDATKAWPFSYANNNKPVARLRIVSQNMNSPAQNKYCENLTFAAWQSQPEHRPLGGVNRSRKMAMMASTLRRHLLNKEPVAVEPTSTKEFIEKQSE